jgi:ribokinase
MPYELDENIDLLVVNEVEAEVFSKCPVKSVDEAKIACETVLSRDQGFSIGVIVTLGEQGALFCDKSTREFFYVEAKKVKAVDTTGAGDAFVGALAHFISKLGVKEIKRSIELACEYATLSVLNKGTQASYPKLADLDSKFKV